MPAGRKIAPERCVAAEVLCNQYGVWGYAPTSKMMASARAGGHSFFRRLCTQSHCQVTEPFLLEVADDENTPCLSFERDCCFTTSDGFHGDELQLTDADAGAADRLQDKAEPLIALSLCSSAKSFIFSFRQFLFFRTKYLPLHFHRFHLAVHSADISEKAIQACQHRIDTAGSVTTVN